MATYFSDTGQYRFLTRIYSVEHDPNVFTYSVSVRVLYTKCAELLVYKICYLQKVHTGICNIDLK